MSDLINEVSLFQGQLCAQLYLADTIDRVLIEEVSVFQGCPICPTTVSVSYSIAQ